MAEWYVLHVHLDREEKIAELLKRKLTPQLYRPFILQKEKFFRRAGVTSIVGGICFPGYVFIESQTSADEFLDAAKQLLWNIKDVHSLLSYDGKEDIALRENSMMLLKRLIGEGDCIKVSRGHIVDGIARVDSGALVGMDGLIKKVDKHNKTAEIEVTLMGEPQRIRLALEIIKS